MAKITVIDADGNPALINEENLPIAVQERGARLPTAEEAQALADKAKYGEGIGNELKAGAAGAARTLTFGLSDVIGADIGRGEDLRKLAEQNPTATLAGEVAGAIAPAVLTGGESLVANAVGKAGAGVRAATAAGRAAEGAAARSLAGLAERGLAGRALATTLAKAAGGAVEGAAFGAGQAVSEAALQDHELTAEQVMQSIGAGALLGGAEVAGGPVEGVADGAGLVGEDEKPGKDPLGGLGAGEVFGTVEDIARLLDGFGLALEAAEDGAVCAGIAHHPVDDPGTLADHGLAQVEAVAEEIELRIIGRLLEAEAPHVADDAFRLGLVGRIGLLQGRNGHALHPIVIRDHPADDRPPVRGDQRPCSRT